MDLETRYVQKPPGLFNFGKAGCRPGSACSL